ncbi:MAG TPA: hypothetical protein VHU41_08840 [Thermoanaerobaculia bacterium]|jgi:hypothetical protein|nr:hypothetical protein [Thermoanaerobaculia bacterium]
MTAAPKRTLIGTESGIATRQRVYETDDGIIVESTDQYELSRKSVLFEDIVLVTYHREFGRVYMLVLSALALVFLGIAATAYASGAPLKVAGSIAAIAAPILIAIIVRLVMKVDVVSVFGRRSRAAIHFSFRKSRARELYGRLCYRTRQAQKVPEEIIQTQSAE